MRGLSSIPPVSSLPKAAIPSPSTGGGFGGTLKNIASLVQSTLGLSVASRLNASGQSEVDLRPLGNSELDLYRMQMEYLATILKRDRTYCPLNGVLQLIPFSWLNQRRQHSALVRSIKKDFEALSRSLRLQFPVTLAVVGLERVMGYDAFIRRCRELHPQSHLMRAGGGFASGSLLDDVGASYLSQMTSTCFRDKAYETFLTDLDNPLNPRLYHLVCELDDEVDNLKHLLQTIGGPDSHGLDTVRHSGCYVAALGESTDGQAFLQGLLVKLLQEQNQVAYTPSEVRRDRWRYRMAMVLFVAAAGLFVYAGYMGWQMLNPSVAPSAGRGQAKASTPREFGPQKPEVPRSRS